METLIGIIVSSVVTFLITRHFYRKEREQEARKRADLHYLHDLRRESAILRG